MDILQAIIKNPAFWAAVVVLLNAIADYALPAFPREIRMALNSLLTIVFAAIAGAQITRVVRVERERKAQRATLERIDVNAGTKTKQ